MDEQPKTVNSSKWPVIAVLSLVVIGGVAYAMNQSNNADQMLEPASEDAMMQETTDPETDAMMEKTSPDAMMETSEGMESETDGVVTFNVSGENFAFNPTEMRVKVGDTVKVTFTNASGTHDWVLDEFDVRTQILEEGQSETVEFVATTAGTYEYYCSVGNHRAMGMVGNLIVE